MADVPTHQGITMSKRDELAEIFSDEQKVEELRKKLTRLFTGVSDFAEQEMMGWTAEELIAMQEYFADVLLYDFARNIEKTLEGAHGNYTVH